jgi:xylulose-5-phosphate/fructose-6-phosphate phosphoketolase
MRVLNQLDRFDLVKAAITMLPNAAAYGQLVAKMNAKITEHHQYIRDEGTDLPEIENWHWESIK